MLTCLLQSICFISVGVLQLSCLLPCFLLHLLVDLVIALRTSSVRS
jgi:hypothetical protein